MCVSSGVVHTAAANMVEFEFYPKPMYNEMLPQNSNSEGPSYHRRQEAFKMRGYIEGLQ